MRRKAETIAICLALLTSFFIPTMIRWCAADKPKTEAPQLKQIRCDKAVVKSLGCWVFNKDCKIVRVITCKEFGKNTKLVLMPNANLVRIGSDESDTYVICVSDIIGESE